MLALAGACGHGSSSAPPPTGDDGGDGGDGGFPEKPRPPSTLALRDIVGLSDHPGLGGDPGSTAERAFEWAALAQLGVHRLRTDFRWAAIEPQRGAFDWSAYDTLVSEAAAHGVDLLAILDYGVPWATHVAGADEDYPPDDPRDFGAFAAAVATRYRGRVSEYEIWNEPNNGLRFWKPTLNGDPARYGALLLEASRDLLAADPQARVAYGGTVYDDLLPGPSFVAQSLAGTPGLAGALQTFAMHAYMIYPPSHAPESDTLYETPLLDKIATMNGVLDAAGVFGPPGNAVPPHDVPFWITEIGWPTMSDDPPAQQARYTVRAIVLAALGGADRVYLYTLLDGPHPDAFPPEDAFGLETYGDFGADADAGAGADAGTDAGGAPTPMPKPAFVAVQALMRAVGGFAVKERLAAGADDVYLVHLTSGAQDAWIAWRALDGAPPIAVTVPASGPVRVTHVDGSTQDDVSGAGGYTLQVGPDPVVVAPRL
jgi:hypothetical protein